MNRRTPDDLEHVPNNAIALNGRTQIDMKQIPEADVENETVDLDANVISAEQFGEERRKVCNILQQDYGMAMTSCTQLDGFDDINYLVTVERKNSNPHVDVSESSQFVLRVINADDSLEPRRIEAIHAVMQHVQAKGIVVQRPVKNLHGDEMSFHTAETDGKRTSHVVVLRNFLPGSPMGTIPLRQTDVFNCGVFVARMRRALQDFHHPFFETFKFSWSADNLSNIKKMIHSVKDSWRKTMVEKILNVCETQTGQVQHRLQWGQIHGDISLNNIIIHHDRNGKDADLCNNHDPVHPTPVDLWGIIDFHDTHRIYAVHDLAITSVHIMTTKQSLPMDRLDIPGHLMAGYQTIISLDLADRHIFPCLVMTYLCQILVASQHYITLNPSNADYLNRIQGWGWTLLESMCEVSPDVLRAKWECAAKNVHSSE